MASKVRDRVADTSEHESCTSEGIESVSACGRDQATPGAMMAQDVREMLTAAFNVASGVVMTSAVALYQNTNQSKKQSKQQQQGLAKRIANVPQLWKIMHR